MRTRRRLASNVGGTRGTSGRTSIIEEGLVMEVMDLNGVASPLTSIRNNATGNLVPA